jgi:enoyl-CoA hydratase/carnithine racemase
MSGKTVRVEVTGEIALVIIDNPPVNALNRAFVNELAIACGQVADDPDIRAVVFTAEGDRAFSAGADISGLPSAPPTPEQLRANLAGECAAFDSVALLPQPTVAAIFGHTLGGGLELSVACDFRVAATTLSAGLPEAKLGYFPASGSLVRLAHLIGHTAAKRLAIIGDSLDAEQAQAIGLVDEVVEADAVLDRAIEFARELAAVDATAARAIKQIINADEARFHAHDVELILDLAAPTAGVEVGTDADGS